MGETVSFSRGGPMSAQHDQVKAMLEGFAEVWKMNDGAAVAGYFTEDGSLINPFGERADGRDAIESMYSQYFGGLLGGTSTEVELTSVRPVGDDHAFADSTQTIY